jgi:hypothetical protein
MNKYLFFVIIASFAWFTLVLSGNSAWSSTSEWGFEAEVDVLLAVESDNVRWNVDDLLSDSDVSLSDQDSGVVNGLGETEFKNLGLESSFHEIFHFKSEDVVEFHVLFIENTNSHQSSEKSVTFEQPLWVFVFEGEQHSGGFSDLGQKELDPPDFFLVLETELSDHLQLGVESFLLVRSFWGDIGLVVVLALDGRHPDYSMF